MHQMINNILRTFKVQNMVLDDENTLASTTFVLRAIVHTTTQYTPAQLMFGRDSIITQAYDVDWKIFRKRK